MSFLVLVPLVDVGSHLDVDNSWLVIRKVLQQLVQCRLLLVKS
jgi:hypothetical protein